jgi:hypothetical protein
MENFSLNTTPRKRGRPITEVGELLEMIKPIYPDVNTRRGLYNKVYLTKSMGIIREAEIENKAYLLNEEKQRGKWTILAELGRVEPKYGKEGVITLAKEICLQKLPTKKAIYYIRECRGIRGATLGNSIIIGTSKQIINTLNNARLTESEILEILIIVRNQYGTND